MSVGSAAVLQCRDLHLSYGSTVALDGLSLDVEPGRMTGFVGPNGAGKTSTMRIILGVLGPDRGEVTWNGRALGAATRSRFGYMPEERGLYPKMRVADQLVYLARLHGLDGQQARRATDDLLERLGLVDRAGDELESLSLGNQQRVQLAAALVHRPDLLVLDEPFSGLDPIGVDVLAGVLREEVERGAPVLFSSHQLELVERLCDTVAIVKAGRIVAAGEVERLRRENRRRMVRVAIDGRDDASWLDGLPGAEPVPRSDHERGLLIALADDVDAQAVLDRARAAGPVTHFSEVLPTLAELFREVVAETPADAIADGGTSGTAPRQAVA
ncbi:ATP-binding cassette domain-containing protein [Conexibacter stalactiti]|uniref:ATP-binding cassette domain-containing protein n=1 Tax=Conexibacter stalactiti TaxID=1940611 RepID=A0ABU4HXJ6_9ACTN|nr:ATP-binding cassette domain-containing protein [Conexibacter stalactiti]MDW5597584.1 ATP-binding cassette domain-containing protein [Conexibacter stalactiti]MEC5038226.1 ATP-binding cassette domain-containing protein [Conexibacter stalactiti]